MIGLRTALRLDALVSGANGLLYLVAAVPIGELLGLAPSLLRGAGAFLVGFAAIVWWVGRAGDVPRRPWVVAVIAINGIWVADGVIALLAGWGSPSTVGVVWIAAQAMVVGAFAELQLAGLRRSGRRRRERGVASAA